MHDTENFACLGKKHPACSGACFFMTWTATAYLWPSGTRGGEGGGSDRSMPAVHVPTARQRQVEPRPIPHECHGSEPSLSR